jgi:hypothetical protein
MWFRNELSSLAEVSLYLCKEINKLNALRNNICLGATKILTQGQDVLLRVSEGIILRENYFCS